MARFATACLLFLLMVLVACVAPAPEPAQAVPAQSDAAAAAAARQPAPAAMPAPAAAPEAAQPADAKPTQRKLPPLRTGGPHPPERVGDRKPDPNTPVRINDNCRTDADCTVKNVGNCCGYYPACVNVDSPTDPEGVQRQCAKDGMASVCGWAEISSCSCVQGRCQGNTSGAAVQ